MLTMLASAAALFGGGQLGAQSPKPIGLITGGTVLLESKTVKRDAGIITAALRVQFHKPTKVPGGKLNDSWKEFFEPRAELKGKIAALNDQGEMFTAAAIYLGIDTCTENPEDAQKVLTLLEKQKPDVKIYSSTGTIDRVAAGEVSMHHQWNGASHRAKLKLATAVFVYPAEGLNLWGDNFAVPKGAANPDNAKIFLNWMMDPKNAAEASNFSGYNNAIKGAEAFMKPELRDNPAINPPEAMKARFKPVKDCSMKARELRDGVWTRLRR